MPMSLRATAKQSPVKRSHLKGGNIHLIGDCFVGKNTLLAMTAGEQEMLARQIESTDGAIDKLVYELYGLTEKEIAIVEGREQ